MARYIDADTASKYMPYSCADVWHMLSNIPPADVIEREKINKAIEEMDKLASFKIMAISFDQSLAVRMCIKILKGIIGENK